MSDENALAASELLGGSKGSGSSGQSGDASNAPWYGEVDDNLKGWVENKGWKSPAEALTSAWNLEKLFGSDKAGNTLVIPKEGDEEGLNALYGRLGMPSSHEGYKYEVPDGQDTSTIDWFKGVAHEAKMNQQQFDKVASRFDSMMDGLKQKSEQEFNQRSEEELSSLKKEWGLAYDAKANAAKAAASKFGFSQAELHAIEREVGTKAIMEKFATIGKSLGEDSFQTGGKDINFTLTPSAAQNQISELRLNKDFMGAYLDSSSPGHSAALEKMTKLMQSAYPG